MGTIKYCDYTSGDDSTGDGSYSSPYKTITKASTGLTGGDEVRCAKSPDDTALTGTIAFTQGSTSIVGTSTLFTSELAIGDFIKGGTGNITKSLLSRAILRPRFTKNIQVRRLRRFLLTRWDIPVPGRRRRVHRRYKLFPLQEVRRLQC